MGWGLATIYFNRYKIAQTLLGRSCILCFETVLGLNNITPTPFSSQKKIKNFQKLFFIAMIFALQYFQLLSFIIPTKFVRGSSRRSCSHFSFTKVRSAAVVRMEPALKKITVFFQRKMSLI